MHEMLINFSLSTVRLHDRKNQIQAQKRVHTSISIYNTANESVIERDTITFI